MTIKIMLNQYDNPRLSEQIFVGKGDKVFAGSGSEEYGFTVNKEYEIKGVSHSLYLVMENDAGEVDEYTVEYFQRHQTVV